MSLTFQYRQSLFPESIWKEYHTSCQHFGPNSCQLMQCLLLYGQCLYNGGFFFGW